MGGTQSPASSTDTSAATSLDLLADLALKSSTSSGGSPEDDVNVDTEMMDGSERRELSQKAGATGVLYLKDGDSANLKAFQVKNFDFYLPDFYHPGMYLIIFSRCFATSLVSFNFPFEHTIYVYSLLQMCDWE